MNSNLIKERNKSIYILSCNLCNQQYVGETGSLKLRLSNHRSSIRNFNQKKFNTNVTIHFNSPGDSINKLQ